MLPRYQLAQVPEAPLHKSAPLPLLTLLDLLRQQLLFRWKPFFVFAEGEDRARAIWCHVCGRVCWNTDHVAAWHCGHCRQTFRP